MKVLVVEDDSSLAEVIDRNLRARGHASRVASTAEGAILEMIERWPDVLVVDVNLPDFSAWEVLRRLGPTSRKAVRVIVVSGAPISQKRIEEFKPAAVLRKPFPLRALLHLVEDEARTAAATGSDAT